MENELATVEFQSPGIKPLLNSFASVLGVIVLLKDNDFDIVAILVQAVHQLILQNFFIKLPIYPFLNSAYKPNTLPIHTASNHSISLSKLYYFFNQLITKTLLSLLSYKLPSIWPQTIDFGLITKLDPLPVLHSPLFIPFCKYQFCLLVIRLE